MEISNLSNTEFKALVLGMLKDLNGHFNSIKKIQADMKVSLCEIKKHLQGINSGGHKAENQINDLGRKQKTINQNNKKKKESKRTKIG